MKQSNVLPLLLLVGGAGAALFISFLAFMDLGAEYAIAFAVAVLIAGIGWSELRATEDFNESLDGE